jgi:hypothetical protein
MRINALVRPISTGLLAAVGLALVGCAGMPAGQAVAISGESPAARFNNGRVMLYVTDMDGKPLSKAMVNIEGAGSTADYFRTAAWSDHAGRVSFNGVPEEVRISVYHAETQGNYSRVFHVPPSGVTELRMLVQPE